MYEMLIYRQFVEVFLFAPMSVLAIKTHSDGVGNGKNLLFIGI